jgi:glycogen debranching enzyme
MLNRREAIKSTVLAGLAQAAIPSALTQSPRISPILSAISGAPGKPQTELARTILADSTLTKVHSMAQSLLQGGLNAGTGYLTTWIRDMNTFIEVAIQVNSPQRFREALLLFLKFQKENGDVPDLYIARDPAKIKPTDRMSPLVPGYIADKNTVETDQESSLVQAVFKYVAATKDDTILDESIAGETVKERLGKAMQYVLSERFDPEHGLVWGGTTIDWGDVQPEGPRGTVLDASSHRALSIYDNAMLVIAMNDYLQLPGESAPEVTYWRATRDKLKKNIRKHLWDEKRKKFIPHVYLAGSPFPAGFDENAIYFHGGTAVAIEAGLLSRDEVAQALAHMKEDVRLAGASSIGLTIYPPYPLGFFHNPQLTVPYTYQNGGDWCWFGGRMIQQLVKYGFIEEAFRNLQPMVERVVRAGDFHEWWTRDNQPRGSAQFRGSAGVLGKAIEMLREWAQRNTA